MTKLYEVTFMQYTNPTKDKVKSEDGKEYIDTDKPLIIKEEDIDRIRKYGNGIKELKYIGQLKEF